MYVYRVGGCTVLPIATPDQQYAAGRSIIAVVQHPFALKYCVLLIPNMSVDQRKNIG